jgi:hypothetical protein
VGLEEVKLETTGEANDSKKDDEGTKTHTTVHKISFALILRPPRSISESEFSTVLK